MVNQTVLAAILALATMPALAAVPWQEKLAAQLEDEEGCVLTFLSQVIEREVDGRMTIIAKAHCEDKRAFDVFRDNANEPFQVKECGVVEKIEC
jgi:hypothetical protein